MDAADPSDVVAVERIWRSGVTLPATVTETYPPDLIEDLADDTGCNVLVDLAHQCSFGMMWGIAPDLHGLGFRSCGSHACLHTVLRPGSCCRIRVPVGTASDNKPVRPFAWWPVPRFNVVITFQSELESQAYLPEEQTAVTEFVSAGGGLVIAVPPVRRGDDACVAAWSLNELAQRFDASFGGLPRGDGGARCLPLTLDSAWERLGGTTGDQCLARRQYGDGHVVVTNDLQLLARAGQEPEEVREARVKRLGELLRWVSAGSVPVGGEPRLPQTFGGGGGIYPELEQRVGNMVVYSAANQKPELQRAVQNELPSISDQLYAWLPSPVPEEPMFMVLAAGNGGGWAVNAFYPKEVGIISLSPYGIYGIFAHELAHTMSGPRNAAGKVAGNWFDGNQGEAHAGFWQGKIWSMHSGNKILRDCNSILDWEAENGRLDLAQPREQLAAGDGGMGRVWCKLWWIWQKLDDRYGTTWYPRWRWVQYTRWQAEPERRLSIEEMIEDMSIAVGRDLFPFFAELGTSLSRPSLGTVTFEGVQLSLPPADLDLAPAGSARYDAIGDYTQPLTAPVAATGQ